LSAYHVITLRGRWPHSIAPGTFLYLGRAWAGLAAHELGNPFRREDPDWAEKFDAWFIALPDLARVVRDLRADTEFGRLPFACWCADWDCRKPVATPSCHAIIVARHMNAWYPKEPTYVA